MGKVSRFKFNSLKLNYLKLILLFLSIGIFAQTKNVNSLLVFQPDENSVKFNEVYTDGFFFGNFGVRHLANAIPVSNENVKSIQISAETEGKKTLNVFELNYDKNGKLIQMKISESLSGKAFQVNYNYKDGLISEEIFKDASGTKSNKFHYAEGKMIVENTKGMIDVYQLKGNVFYKQSFLDGKEVFKDRIEGKCRITAYQNQDIDKTCYSSFSPQIPFWLEEYSNTENTESKTTNLIPEHKWNLVSNSENDFSFLNGKTELYKLKLNKNKNVESFEFLGIKNEFKPAILFTFKYELY